MRPIASDANPTFRRWLKLATQPRAVRESGRTLAEGIHLAQAVLAANVRIEALLARRGAKGAAAEALIDSVAQRGVPAFELAAALFDRISPVEAGAGLMLEIAVPPPGPAPGIAEDLVYLDGIQDPGNAGALLRVAAAAGVGWVLAAPGTVSLWAPRTLRAGQGAHFVLKLIEGAAAAGAAERFDGNWIAAAAHDADPLWQVRIPETPVGWVFGAEGRGISEAMLARCDRRVRIPLAAGIESLNVAAAAAVCLFERRRRIGAAK